jgi:hypothetical protein
LTGDDQLTGIELTGTELTETGVMMALMEMLQPLSAPSDAPGGISTNLVLRTKADDAGCSAGSSCSSWKDNSVYANNVEIYGSMTLQSANAAHNFQPYFANFSSSNHFREANSSFAANGNEAKITVVAIARPTNPSSLNSNSNYGGRILGFDNTADEAGEP